MSDQLIEGCLHEWSAENVKVRRAFRTGATQVMVICKKCYAPKPTIDISKPPSGKQILNDSK